MSAPTAATPHSLAVNGGATFAYLKQGSGPALVIIHGVGGHKEDWQGVMAVLSVQRTVCAVDMLGFGGSSRDAADLSMAAQAAALKALLDKEGAATADVLGNSVGGWVAATFAATYPQMTRKVAVVDPAGFADMFKGEPPVNLFPDDVDQMKKLLGYVIHADFAHTDAFAQKAYDAFVASKEKSIEARLGPALYGSPRLEDVMPRIKAPTLVIWGQEDKLFPVALAPYIASLTPGAKTEVIPAASHFPQVDQPERFNAIVARFFAG